jgi:Lysyl-tRNA synthetase (class II)
VREQFKEGETRRVAGRITAHRDMGKSHFLDLRDVTGRIQIYIHAKEIGPELFDLFRLLDMAISLAWKGHVLSPKAANRQ